jgi:adenylate cyclase
VWADRFDGSLEDIFSLQDEITRKVVGAIEPTLRFAEMDRIRSKPTSDLGAYELLLRAVFELSTFSPENVHNAVELLQAAVERDPNYSDAWATLASTVCFRMVSGVIDHEEARELGSEAAYRAVRSDPESPLALASAAATLSILGLDFNQALEFADKALSLAPTSAPVLAFCGFTYNFQGDFEKALNLLQEARRLSPRDPRGVMIQNQIAMSYLFSRRFEEAIEWTRRNLAEHPRFAPSWGYLACALGHVGRIAEAREAVAGMLNVMPNARLSRSSRNRWRHPWMVQFYVEGLRLAGLPE